MQQTNGWRLQVLVATALIRHTSLLRQSLYKTHSQSIYPLFFCSIELELEGLKAQLEREQAAAVERQADHVDALTQLDSSRCGGVGRGMVQREIGALPGLQRWGDTHPAFWKALNSCISCLHAVQAAGRGAGSRGSSQPARGAGCTDRAAAPAGRARGGADGSRRAHRW